MNPSDKLLETAGLAVALALASMLLRLAVRSVLHPDPSSRARFWSQQSVHLLVLAAFVVGIAVIWAPDVSKAGGVLGIVSAGIAVALQRVITAFAAYLIILRGRVFTVGDRITIGGVRGDVVALGFMQTTVMEMGQAPGEESDTPSMWVHARQYTGRVVRVTNDKIFDAPVYNYTREFPFFWEEMMIPISYKDDRTKAEQIILDAATRHTSEVVARATPYRSDLLRAYPLKGSTDLEPRVYWQLTDNWVALTVRFLTDETGVRALKDAMSRDIIAGLDAAQIGIASGTYEIVGVPPIRIESLPRATTGR